MRIPTALAVLAALTLAACAPGTASEMETDDFGEPLVVQTEGDLLDALGGYGYILRNRILTTSQEFPTIDVSEYTVEIGPDGARSSAFFQVYTFGTTEAAEEAASRAQRRSATARRAILQQGRIVVISIGGTSRLQGDLRRLLTTAEPIAEGP